MNGCVSGFTEFGQRCCRWCNGYIGSMFNYLWTTKRDRDRDDDRKKLLKEMLDDKRFEWRKLSTLSQVVGANEDETARLLIEIKARGSEGEDEYWGYITDHPLEKIEK